jgi:hypothetical protein
MFVEGANGGGREPDARERLLIWCLRRLAPDAGLQRSPVVEVALLKGFGERGQELSVLLRCLVHALALHCPRRLTMAVPHAPALTADEVRLLLALRGGGPVGLGPPVVLGPLLLAIGVLMKGR